MTLDRHKSHLIPDVQYSLDGTLFVTDVGGTFPLRGRAAKREDIRDIDFSEVAPPASFRSYDLRREEKKRRYKQRGSPGRDVASEMSTISNNTSSLGRRLRRSKRRSRTEFPVKEKRFSFKSNSSTSAPPSGRRIQSGPPRMTPEFADTLRKKSNRDCASGLAPGDKLKRTKTRTDDGPYSCRASNGSGYEKNARYHKIHDERLPYALFLVDGVCLILIGIARIIVTYWHEYYATLSAGLLVFILGVVGSKHKGMYLAKDISAAYIVTAFLSGLATLTAAGITLYVFLPMVIMLTEDVSDTQVIENIAFTNMNRTLFKIDISSSAVIWSSLALDIGSLMFLFLGFFTMTAAMISLSNHWDACYDTTADCDHRGNPRMFNPVEQVILGVASTFVGLVYIGAEAGFVNVNYNHYYCPLWSPVLMIFSGCVSFCFGKRPDKTVMGAFACFLEILAFLGCSAAIVMTTLGIVDHVTSIKNLPAKTGRQYKEFLGIVVIEGVVDFLLTINVIFTVGSLFRQFRQISSCCGEDGSYAWNESGSKYDSSKRRQYAL